jgi:hypothetical protein
MQVGDGGKAKKYQVQQAVNAIDTLLALRREAAPQPQPEAKRVKTTKSKRRGKRHG